MLFFKRRGLFGSSKGKKKGYEPDARTDIDETREGTSFALDVASEPDEDNNETPLDQGNRAFESVYKLGRKLGSGSYATVYECTHLGTGAKAAVKVIDKSKLKPGEDKYLLREVALMRDLQHPNIVRFHELIEEPSRYFVVMDLCKGGELFDRVIRRARYTEKTVRDVIRCLLESISYCHDRGIVHRDIKPQNLLVESDVGDCTKSLKLADFGFARTLDPEGEPLKMKCGSPNFIAPEILEGSGYGREVDVWSAGVILHILLCGHYPFQHADTDALFELIKRGSINLNRGMLWAMVSDEAKDLVRRMLTVNPANRITAKEALNHPWMLQSDQELDGCKLPCALDDLKVLVRWPKRFSGNNTGFSRFGLLVEFSSQMTPTTP